eukprot:TRINITY_DN59_c0_g2_i1.p1 TRINITY_DN59_c0_g2~~TRINITY_DN59_c0_g2_i1.p1  ORF type:complete len:443 (+),score=85.94 TRINITY_DN59_c0_g2_i1:44-1330(+)
MAPCEGYSATLASAEAAASPPPTLCEHVAALCLAGPAYVVAAHAQLASSVVLQNAEALAAIAEALKVQALARCSKTSGEEDAAASSDDVDASPLSCGIDCCDDDLEAKVRWVVEERKLRAVNDDPRSMKKKGKGKNAKRIGGANTDLEDHDPASTFVRPAIRVIASAPTRQYNEELASDDVLIVPGLLCAAEDLSMYYTLISEIRQLQADGVKEANWSSWKNGWHLISKVPDQSPTYQLILKRVFSFFQIVEESAYVRFNWYANGSDWKPLHHDTAQFSQRRAGKQNITVAVSLGAEREVVFRHCEHGTRGYFPQSNGMAYSFGECINRNWKHGINALPEEEWDNTGGRVSIIVWGWSEVASLADAELTETGRPGPEAFNRPCLQFQRGKCTYGDRCKFNHVPAEQSEPDLAEGKDDYGQEVSAEGPA